MTSSPRAGRPSTPLPAQVSPPQFALSGTSEAAITAADVVAYAVQPGAGAEVLLSVDAQEFGASVGLDLAELVSAEAEAATAGHTVTVPVVTGDRTVLLLLVGVGSADDGSLRRAGAAVGRAALGRDCVVSSIPALSPTGLEPFVVGLMLASFSFRWRAETDPSDRPVARVVLTGGTGDDEARDVLERAVAIGGAGWRARTLATVPSNVKTPAWLADQARAAGEDAGLRVEVWEPDRLQREGMGGIVGVGQASINPPRLIQMDYSPAKGGRRTPRVVLVGKGITFDTGGLSIKPAESMTTMKRDMTGGAVVISVLAALADVGCPVRVTGLIATAENSVSGNSLRPGDVIRHYGGRTSEVTNTDAEGRLVMADALAYAVDKLDPAVLVDVATLTGAMKVALGQTLGGYFATDDALAASLETAATAAGEPLWRMPLVADYEEKLASKIADADNAPGGGGGAITAALFLKPFVGDVPWAHLDVASAGDAPRERFEWTTGPTGYGSRALLAWLGSPQPLAGIGG